MENNAQHIFNLFATMHAAQMLKGACAVKGTAKVTPVKQKSTGNPALDRAYASTLAQLATTTDPAAVAMLVEHFRAIQKASKAQGKVGGTYPAVRS